MYKKITAILFIAILLIPAMASAAEDDNNTHLSPDDKITPIVFKDINLTANSTAFGEIKLTWEKDENITAYTVFKYDALASDYIPIANITDKTEFIDEKVEENKEYFYQVTPTFDATEKANSNISKIKTSKGSPTVSVVKGTGTAKVSWGPVTGATKYDVYRGTTLDGEYSKIATVEATSYGDMNLPNQSKYYYKVRASQGDSIYSDFSKAIPSGIILTDSWSLGQLAWPMPSSHTISSGFGNRTAPTAGATSTHDGLDIPAPEGTPVVASNSGTVTKVTSSSARGIYIEITHGNGLVTRYQHLSSSEVSVGTTVERGDLVAKCGNTGISTGSHLHFEILLNGTPVDPNNYIKK